MPRARTFAAKLLAIAPENAEYVAVMADTYARQGDDRGLRTFYDSKIRGRTQEHAAMRRALIPVLTRMKDYSGAVDQYIEVLNQVSGRRRAGSRSRAVCIGEWVGARSCGTYYVKAAGDSPKDFRWPMVLGRIETQLEDFPSAIAAYTRAAGVRPDRADFLMARLNLEVRLLRFDEAAGTATKLYDLTYRDPRWMDKLAEIRARQGRRADAVAALEKAWIEGRAANAANLLSVAERLDAWGMVKEARGFADQALKLSPDDAVRTWARIAMREREFDAVLTRLVGLKDEIAPVAMIEIGRVVQSEYSPEEKVKFVASLEKNPRRVDVADDAGLVDVEAKWLAERMMAHPDDEKIAEWKEKLIRLQEQRLAFDELGAQLEAFVRLPGAQSSAEAIEAANAYRASGNTAAELRMLQFESDRTPLAGPLFDRYAALLMASPQRLVAAITRERRAEVANSLVNFAVEHGTGPVVQQAIAARGRADGRAVDQGLYGAGGSLFCNEYPSCAGGV